MRTLPSFWKPTPFPVFLASLLTAQQVAPPPATPAAVGAMPRNFYHDYQLTPIGSGEKLLLTLQAGGQKIDLIVEPVPPKDDSPVTQYVLYLNGGVTLYTKTTIILPNPNGGEGTPIEGLSVMPLPTGNSPVPRSASAPSGHQTVSEYTTPPRKSPSFKIPVRFEKAGFGMGRPRFWIIWDGQNEIEVEPVDTNFKGSLLTLVPIYNIEQWATGNLNHLKFMSNRYTEGSRAPRYFYMKRNKDDSITVFGNDDLAKLQEIAKKK